MYYFLIFSIASTVDPWTTWKLGELTPVQPNITYNFGFLQNLTIVSPLHPWIWPTVDLKQYFLIPTTDFQPWMENTCSDPQLVESVEAKPEEKMADCIFFNLLISDLQNSNHDVQGSAVYKNSKIFYLSITNYQGQSTTKNWAVVLNISLFKFVSLLWQHISNCIPMFK